MANTQSIELLNYNKMQHASFDCWTFESCVPNTLLKQIEMNSAIFKWGLIEGKRTDKNYRIWMNNYEASCFKKFCSIFDSYETKSMFSDIVGTDFTLCDTRIELCKDEAGSWLHNHFDDKAKLFTLQLYLTNSSASTSFNNKDSHASIGHGWFFRNTARELHGLSPLPARRMSIIVNYVDDTWRDRSVLV